jgi:hypothetical protein
MSPTGHGIVDWSFGFLGYLGYLGEWLGFPSRE